jgi:hypothetical protein
MYYSVFQLERVRSIIIPSNFLGIYNSSQLVDMLRVFFPYELHECKVHAYE